MKIGMLWFASEPNATLTEKVLKAAAYFKNKYGRTPTLCHLNPMDAGDQRAVGAIELIPNPLILRFHLWIGVNEPEKETIP